VEAIVDVVLDFIKELAVFHEARCSAEFIRYICGIRGKLRAGKSIVDGVVVNLNGVLHKAVIKGNLLLWTWFNTLIKRRNS
jgi:hypothetical protein